MLRRSLRILLTAPLAGLALYSLAGLPGPPPPSAPLPAEAGATAGAEGGLVSRALDRSLALARLLVARAGPALGVPPDDLPAWLAAPRGRGPSAPPPGPAGEAQDGAPALLPSGRGWKSVRPPAE